MRIGSRRSTFKFHLAGRLFATIFTSGWLLAVAPQSERGRERHDPVQDAEVTLTLVGDTDGAKFSALLRNQGPKPLFLVIGTIMANDKWLCPSRIELLIAGPNGKAHRSESSVGCNPGGVIGGRMDPLIIPLSPGAAYSLPVLNLRGAAAGRYSVKARYTGVPISLRSSNLDMQGLSLIHYWTGAVESNTVTANLP